MQLTGLKELYSSMREQELTRYKFEFRYNQTNFDVFFFTDEQPFMLMFGVKFKNFYFELPVERGFVINTYLGDTYQKLCEILELKYDPNSKFSTRAFFHQFNDHIPVQAKSKNKPLPQEIAQYKRNVEEADKIYFCGWLENSKRGFQVSEANLEKTKQLLGLEAYKRCKERNISSRWTDVSKEARPIELP